MTLRGPVFTVRPQTYKPWDQAQPNYLVTVLATVAPTRKFKQIPDERPWPPYSPPADVLFPNIVIRTTVAQPKTVAIFDRPWLPYSPPADFLSPNVALQAFAQSLVHPVGVELDETVPQPPPHQLDFQFPNVVLRAFAQSLVHPQGATLDESVPAVFPRPIDFQFANVAALDAAQRLVKSPPPKLDFVAPSPQPRQVDLLPPNLLAVRPTGKPTANPIFDRPAPAIQVQDFLFANLLTSTLSAAYRPVGAIWGPWPQPPPRQLEFFPSNLAIHPAPAQVTFRPPLISRPVATSLRVDAPIPNLLTTTLLVLGKPIAPQLFGDRPQFLAHPVDSPPPNLVINAPSVVPQQFVFRSPLISRPVATSISRDAPLPNLLTSTLSVAAANPVGSIVFASRPSLSAPPVDFQFPNLALAPTFQPGSALWQTLLQPATIRPQDAAPPNLLPALLQTVARKPIVPNLFLMADRPSPQAPPVDFPPPNSLVFKPPPVVNLELHQNPFFTTMGRLSQLGNLPS